MSAPHNWIRVTLSHEDLITALELWLKSKAPNFDPHIIDDVTFTGKDGSLSFTILPVETEDGEVEGTIKPH